MTPLSTKAVPIAPGGLPVLGHTVAMLRDPVGLLQSVRAYGDIVRLRIGTMNVYVLNSPQVVGRVLATDASTYRKGRFYEKFRPYQGAGLFTVDGPEHQQQRRLVSPAFHRDRLARYAEVMQERALAHCSAWADGTVLDVRAEMYRLSADVVARVLFGRDLPPDGAERIIAHLPVFIEGMGRKVVSPAGWFDRLPTSGNRRFDEARAQLRSLVDALIGARGKDAEERTDLLSMLLASRDDVDGGRLPLSRVRDEAMNFLTAGIETVSTTLTWLYHELANHPDVENRLLDELDKQVGTRAITFEELPGLEYTQRVIRESLRLHSPAWMLMRRPARDTELAGYRFPAGAELLCSPVTLHRDPALYPEPMSFLPDRWLTASQRPPTYLPFSAGPYKCVGDHFALTELATTVATISTRWRLRKPPVASPPREVAGAALAPDHLSLICEAR